MNSLKLIYLKNLAPLYPYRMCERLNLRKCLIIVIKLYFMPLMWEDSGELTEKNRVEREEQDRQRTSRQESNSGRHEHSCTIYWCTKHKAIDADRKCLIFLPSFFHNFTKILGCITCLKGQQLFTRSKMTLRQCKG